MTTTRMTAAILVALFYVLHQDLWFWREARPLVFGVLPIGLFYHAAYTVAASLLLWGLVTFLWPSQLEGYTDRVKGSPPSNQPRGAARGEGVAASDALGGVQGSPPSNQ